MRIAQGVWLPMLVWTLLQGVSGDGVAVAQAVKEVVVFEQVYTYDKPSGNPVAPAGIPVVIPVQPGDIVTFTAGAKAGDPPDLRPRLAGKLFFELTCFHKRSKDTDQYSRFPDPNPRPLEATPLKDYGPTIFLPGSATPVEMRQANLKHIVAAAGNITIAPLWLNPNVAILGDRTGAAVPSKWQNYFLDVRQQCECNRNGAPETQTKTAPFINTAEGNLHLFPLHVEVKRQRME